MVIILKRKILAAIFSSLLLALIFSVLGGFEGDGFYTIFYLNLMFAITYGVIASFFSDWLSKKIATGAYTREITSFFLHCGCGALIPFFGLYSAILYFILDRLFVRMNIGWVTVIIPLLIVVILFVFLING